MRRSIYHKWHEFCNKYKNVDDITLKRHVDNKIIYEYIINEEIAKVKLNEMWYAIEQIGKDEEIIDIDLNGLNEEKMWKQSKGKRDNLPFYKDFLNKDEKMRVKGSIILLDKYKKFGVRLHRSLSLLHLTLDDPYYLDKLLGYVKNVAGFKLAAKLLGDYMKKYGSMITDSWYKLVNLETIIGYQFSIDSESFNEQIEEWVTGNPCHGYPSNKMIDNNKVFLTELARAMYTVLNEGHFNEKNMDIPTEYGTDESKTDYNYEYNGNMSYHDFVIGGSWARKGSSSTKVHLKAEIGGKDIRLAETKNSVANYGDLEKLYKDSLDNKIQQYGKGIRKSERAKLRAVLGMDMETFLPMSFIDEFIGNLMRGVKLSTLWMKTTDILNFEARNAKLTTNSTAVFVPLDQSQFDHQISREMLFLALIVIRSKLIDINKYKGDVKKCMDIIVSRLTTKGKMGYVETEGKKIKIEHGILSGWKWTAFLDTLINLGEFKVAIKALSDIGVKIAYEINAQGDDDNVVLSRIIQGIMISETYIAMGLKINPAKFFIKKSINEYLRKVYVRGVLTGYSARMILTFIEINPIRDQPKSELAELTSIIKNYCDWFKRADPIGCTKKKIKNNLIAQMLYDVYNSIVVRKKKAKVIIGDKIWLKLLKNVTETKFELTIKSAIIIPSGMGKTTLTKKFRKIFEDIDDVVFLRYPEIFGILNKKKLWQKGNKLSSSIVEKYANKNKVLLAHSIKQLPKGYRILGYITSEGLFLDKILRERTLEMYQISKQNRQSVLEEGEKEKSKLIVVNSIMDFNYTIDNIIMKLRIESDNNIIKRLENDNKENENIKVLIYNKSDWLGMEKLKFLILTVGYDTRIEIDINMENYIEEKYPELYKTGLVDYIEGKSMSIEDIDKQIFRKYRNKIYNRTLNIFGKMKVNYLLENWLLSNISEDWLCALNTPAYIGGIGMGEFLKGGKWERNRLMSIDEVIIKPYVKYPPSDRIEEVKNKIFKETGYRVELDTLYESAQPKNKVFKPIGIVRVRRVFDNLIINYRTNILSGKDYAKMIISGTLSTISVVRPIVKEEIRINKFRMEGYQSLLTKLDSVKDIDNILEKMMRNYAVLINRRKDLTIDLWRDWIRGRIKNKRPLRMCLSDKCVGTYYNLNVALLVGSSKSNNKIGYNVLNSMLKRIELYELDDIERTFAESKIYMLN